ncbi:MAG: hypothetical protein K2K73_00765 [Ureaplasma sp.]|nr:hypothetical protein [Ureaplasma sp.]
MSNKSLILNLYNQSVSYLDLTFLDETLIELVKSKEEFRKIITNLLTFIIDCEDNELVKNKNQERLLAAFYALTNKEFEPNTTITFKTETELEQEINSFNEYLIKTINKNFDEVKLEFQEKHIDEAKKVESEVFTVPTDADSENIKNENNDNQNHSSNNSNFDAEEFVQNNKMNFNDMAESMIAASANSLLIMNIRKGSVYQYKSKPKIIPILKWLIVAIICVLIGLSIASFVLLMVAGPKVAYHPKKDGIVQEDIISYGLQLATPFPFQLLLTTLILVLMIMSMVKNSKNENFKYYMSWGWMLMYILTLVFVWFMVGGIGSNLLFNYSSFLDDLSIVKPESGIAISLIEAYRVIQFTIIGLLGLMVVFLIVGCVFNPKKDFERLQLLLQEYINDIKNGSIPFDGGINDFGRFSGNLF